MKGIIFFTTAQNIMRSPQTQWDILCPVITSVEVSDFPLGRGMNKGRTGVCLSMRVSVFLWVFLVSAWRWGRTKFEWEVRENSSPKTKKSPY